MSCDNELANEWARCTGKDASYITIMLVGIMGTTIKGPLDQGDVYLKRSVKGGIFLKLSVLGEVSTLREVSV